MSNFLLSFFSQAQQIRTLWPISYCRKTKQGSKQNKLFVSSIPFRFFLYSYDTFPNRASHSRLYIHINIFCCICVIWWAFCTSSTIYMSCPIFLNISTAYSSVFRCLCLVVKKNTYCYSVFWKIRVKSFSKLYDEFIQLNNQNKKIKTELMETHWLDSGHANVFP